jgi:hypothetical protein
MSTSSPDKERFRQLVRSKFTETTEVCARKGVEMAIVQASLNLIFAGELIKLGSALAIRLGADEDGVARLARGCYNEAVVLARAPRMDSL